MKRWFVCAIFVVAAIVASPASAQEFWQKKPYKNWSNDEVNKLLEDSPWARKQVIQGEVEATARLGISQEDTGRQANPQLWYIAQIRSALPVRQAMVRRSQIAAKYDKMPEDQKKNADAQAEKFLGAEFPDTFVVYVEYGSNVQMDALELDRYWTSVRDDAIPVDLYLVTPKGERINPVKFQHVRSGIQLTFPRTYQSEPLLNPNDGSFKLELPHKKIHGERDTRVLIEFKVAKMIQDGKVVY